MLKTVDTSPLLTLFLEGFVLWELGGHTQQ